MFAITSANVVGKNDNIPKDGQPILHTSLNLAACQYRIWQGACEWQRPTARLKRFFLAKLLRTVTGSEIFSSSHSSINPHNVTTNAEHLLDFFFSPLLCRPQALHSLGKQSAPLPFPVGKYPPIPYSFLFLFGVSVPADVCGFST